MVIRDDSGEFYWQYYEDEEKFKEYGWKMEENQGQELEQKQIKN